MVAQGLMEVGMGLSKKLRRPSLEDDRVPTPTRPRMVCVDPSDDAGHDGLFHWPIKDLKCRRIAQCETLKSDTYCEKCDWHFASRTIMLNEGLL
ncbi:hypothetical protein SNE40_022083 [Patella caerulea]|uniref:Uncharacterized protein n=1 Tax=Patella caerulea TaxID=87958 RepID=A0AAN8GJG7_PATCE